MWSGFFYLSQVSPRLGIWFIGVKMNGAVLVAVAAAIGNFLQGWDNATIAGTSWIYLVSIFFFNVNLESFLP